ncbi:MAG: hypothetical protein E7497_05975 [Ruminococcus sp.]|nr:hypothetical protein [Ruminococcus sp.]
MSRDFKWELSGFIFVSIVGTLLHFVYDWSGEMNFVGAFSAVSESVWEHLKLLFVPTLVWTLIEYFSEYRNIRGFLTAKAIALLYGMLFITTAFYLYSGVIGRTFIFVDVLLFYIGAYITSNYSLKHNSGERYSNLIGIAVFTVLAVCFVVFTYVSPDVGIFADMSQ